MRPPQHQSQYGSLHKSNLSDSRLTAGRAASRSRSFSREKPHSDNSRVASRSKSREKGPTSRAISSSAVDIQIKNESGLDNSKEQDAERELSHVLASSDLDGQSAMLHNSSSMPPGTLASQIYSKLTYVQRRSESKLSGLGLIKPAGQETESRKSRESALAELKPI